MKTASVTKPLYLELLEEKQRNTSHHTLPSGRQVEFGIDKQEYIKVHSRTGHVELLIKFTSEGPLLTFSAAEIAMESRGKMELKCKEFTLQAEQSIQLKSAGDALTEIAGESKTHVGKQLVATAEEVSIEATKGDTIVKANDFVRVHGEKILLNTELDPETEQKKIQAFLNALEPTTHR